MSIIDKTKNFFGGLFREWYENVVPPPQKDVFQISGELSPDQFTRAGDHIIKICKGWQWKPSSNPKFKSQYLIEEKQYLVLEKCRCKRRLNKTLELPVVKKEKPKQQGEDDVIILQGGDYVEEEENIDNFRYYTMYIMYDQYYHTPRMFFSATKQNGTPVTNEEIKYDIQREYLDKTLTMEKFPFNGVVMPTVHPCRHAAVLKGMSDTMIESGHQVESHFSLLIFLNFISSVIPYVEFEVVETILF